MTIADVAACLVEVALPGKRGLATLGAVLDDRGVGYVPPASELERRLFQTMTAAGLPDPVRQYPLPGRHPCKEVVDAAYPDAMIIIEADGRRWHSRLRDVRRDHARDAQAALAGWITLRFTYEEVTGAPDEVAATISGIRATRLAQFHPTTT
jgi:very-short-patch-repair endonuclease